MQVFICYAEPLKVAQTMWADQRRYNKAIIECKQIIAAIDGAKAWRNHPVCLMYKPYRRWIVCYMECLDNFSKYKKGLGRRFFGENEHYLLTNLYNIEANKVRPPFLTKEFCDQHKRRLYTKAPHLYPQFAEYGTSEENWYYLNGEIVKYKDGKRIK